MPLHRQTSGGSTNKLDGSALQAGSVPQWTASQNNVARQLMYYYLAAGMSKAGAAGMIGNQMQESSLNPAEAGGYLSQWGGSRLTALQTFASNMGLPVTSVKAQASFVVSELKTSYASLWSYLQSTTDPAAAALRISSEYERPLASAANNSGRQQYAALAYSGLTGVAYTPPDGSAQGSGSPASSNSGPTSVLDLLTSPVPTIGGWLASIAVTVVKDTATGIGDFIIVPFVHWQERAIMAYYKQMFGPGAWPMIPWNAAFWGLGYWLLFTDPSKGLLSVKPAPSRNSRIGNHVRGLQSVPARRELVKPADVTKKTPRKPKPVQSHTTVRYVRSMGTERRQPVRITGDTNEQVTNEEVNYGRRSDTTGAAGVRADTGRKPRSPSRVPHARDRTRGGTLPRRAATSRNRPSQG